MQRGHVVVPAAGKRFRLTRPVVPELQFAKTVASVLDMAMLEPVVWTHFPAGLGKLPPATVGRAKAMGLKAGIPDYLFWHNGRSIGIELKRQNGVLSDVQKEMHKNLRAAGMPVYVCRTPEEVIQALDIEGFPMRRNFVDAILREHKHGQSSTAQSSAAESEARTRP